MALLDEFGISFSSLTQINFLLEFYLLSLFIFFLVFNDGTGIVFFPPVQLMLVKDLVLLPI